MNHNKDQLLINLKLIRALIIISDALKTIEINNKAINEKRELSQINSKLTAIISETITDIEGIIKIEGPLK